MKEYRRRIMKYDLIVVGGGPAGLMAAKTAAEDGLKVLLIEKRRDIGEERFCGQFTNIKMINVGGKVKYGYAEPLNLEVGTDKTVIHFPGPGFSINYDGPIRPYFNYIHFSPGGYRVYREKDRFIGFCWAKEVLLAGIRDEAEEAGVEIVTGTIATAVENTPDGAKVYTRTRAEERTLEARKVLAADGCSSLLVESLGLNKGRKTLGVAEAGGGVGYMLEGVETEYRLNSWICFTIPSLNPRMNLWMYMVAGDRNVAGTTAGGTYPPGEATERLMRLPAFEPWFHQARLVRKFAQNSAKTRAPIREPVAGNVLIIGDAACLVEVSNPGAIACGYMGAKATLKELNGEKGYPEYVKWWQNSFDFNDPTYLKGAGRFFSLNSLCSDEEVDYLYQLVQDQVGVPGRLISENLELVKGDRPQLYAKLKKAGMGSTVDEMKVEMGDTWGKEKEV